MSELEQAARDVVKHAKRAPARMNASEERPSGEVIVVRPETFYALQKALRDSSVDLSPLEGMKGDGGVGTPER